MVTISNGVIRDARVKYDYCALLDHGPIGKIDGIVVHQTDSSTASGTISGYKLGGREGGLGAHFLIDKDGTVFQCVPVTRRCAHVGQLKSRCMEEHTCDAKTQALHDEWARRGLPFRKT